MANLAVVVTLFSLTAGVYVEGVSVRITPSTLDASVGDHVSLDCIGSSDQLEFYIHNRIAWTFTNKHGDTSALTYGFYPAQDQVARFAKDKYELDYGHVGSFNGNAIRFRLNITAAYTGDAGTYACTLFSANGTQLSRDQVSLNVTVPLPPCADDPEYRCDRVIATFNVCSDIHHAKLACRKSCHLCSLADGGWGDWSSWSDCHVAFGFSNRTRTRLCDSPAPANGGLHCVGANNETKPCGDSASSGQPAVMSVPATIVHAIVGDHVTLDCRGSNPDWAYYVNNKVHWTFRSTDGMVTRNLTSGFYTSSEFDMAKYAFDFGKVKSSLVDVFRFRLNIKSAYTADSGVYKCSLMSESLTEINRATIQLNVTVPSSTCEDDPKYQCGFLLGTFSICSDVNHAKVACKKSCHLCNLADGVWGDWTPWSACHVTCGAGNRTRTRKCDSPAPAHGGLNCTGSHVEAKVCSGNSCPVDGGWSAWEAWGEVLAGSTRVKSRSRTCSNPTPSSTGRRCLGRSSQCSICTNVNYCQTI